MIQAVATATDKLDDDTTVQHVNGSLQTQKKSISEDYKFVICQDSSFSLRLVNSKIPFLYLQLQHNHDWKKLEKYWI